MTNPEALDLDGVLVMAEALVANAETDASPLATADRLVSAGEVVLEAWLDAHGQEPTRDTVEGYRVLALHRQAAKSEISFNACRETCRELVYLRNVVDLSLVEGTLAQARHHLKLQAMVLSHLALFVGGKLQESGLGDFCCSSRPLRGAETPSNIDQGAALSQT